MAKSSSAALRASKNVLCANKDRHRYLALPGELKLHSPGACKLSGLQEKRCCWMALKARAAAPYLRDRTNTWWIWSGQQPEQHSRPLGSLLHQWNTTLQVTFSHRKTEPGDNSRSIGLVPRRRASPRSRTSTGQVAPWERWWTLTAHTTETCAWISGVHPRCHRKRFCRSVNPKHHQTFQCCTRNL